MKEIITLNAEDWKTKIEHRKRDRMKITFKLTKEQATAYKNFKDTIQGGNPDASDTDIALSCFFTGIETMGQRLQALAEEYEKNHKEELANSEEDGTMPTPELQDDESGSVEIL